MGRPLKLGIAGYLRRPLDAVLGTAANVAVLRALSKITRATGREVARVAGMNAQAAHEALGRLEVYGVIRRTPAGKAHVFELNRDHFLVRQVLLPLLEGEVAFRQRLYQVLSEAIAGKAESGVIFGSVARGEEGAASDFDVCILVDKDPEKDGAANSLSRVFEMVWREFGLKLSPIVFTRAEFLAGYRKGKALFRDIVAEAETFHGAKLDEVVGVQKGPTARGEPRGGAELRQRGK